MNKEIFHQTGKKFIVKKADLLNALKKNIK